VWFPQGFALLLSSQRYCGKINRLTFRCVVKFDKTVLDPDINVFTVQLLQRALTFEPSSDTLTTVKKTPSKMADVGT